MCDFGLHQGLAHARVRRMVGVNDVLVDTPGNLEGNVPLAGEQVTIWCCLRAMSSGDLVCNILWALYKESVAIPAPMMEFLFDTPAALIESVPGEVHDVEGVHDCGCAGEFFGGGTLESSEFIHRDYLDALAPGARLGASQVLNTCLDRPGIISRSREEPLWSQKGFKSKIR